MNRPRTDHHRCRAAGFTLIEILVAVTLVALMSLALWGLLRISVNSWKRGTESMEENQKRRTTVDLMQKQLASISAQIVPPEPQTGIGQYPIFFGTDTGFQFLSPCGFRFQDNPGMNFISYDVVSGADGDSSLVERETRYLGGDPTAVGFPEDADQGAITILDHLSNLSVEYFDEGTMNEQPQWVTEWDSMTEMRLPAAIRIALAARQADGTSLARQFVVPVMSKPFLQLQPGFINPFNSPVMAPRGGRGTALEDLRRSFEERLGRGRGRGNDPRTKK